MKAFKSVLVFVLVLSFVNVGDAKSFNPLKAVKKSFKAVTKTVGNVVQDTVNVIEQPKTLIPNIIAAAKKAEKDVERAVRDVRDNVGDGVAVLMGALRAGIQTVTGGRGQVINIKRKVQEQSKRIVKVSAEVDKLLTELQALAPQDIVLYSTASTFSKAFVRAQEMNKVDVFWQLGYPDHFLALSAIYPVYGLPQQIDSPKLKTCAEEALAANAGSDGTEAEDRIEDCLRGASSAQAFSADDVFKRLEQVQKQQNAARYFSLYDCELKRIIWSRKDVKDLKCGIADIKDHEIFNAADIQVSDLTKMLTQAKDQLEKTKAAVDAEAAELEKTEELLAQQEQEYKAELSKLEAAN